MGFEFFGSPKDCATKVVVCFIYSDGMERDVTALLSRDSLNFFELALWKFLLFMTGSFRPMCTSMGLVLTV